MPPPRRQKRLKFKQRLQARGYPKTLVESSLPGVTFASRQSALTKKKNENERLLPFVTTYQPAVKNLKQILMEQWSLIQNQPLLKTIYKKRPIISYKRGKSLEDTLVRAKKKAFMRCDRKNHMRSPCRPVFNFLSRIDAMLCMCRTFLSPRCEKR